MFTGSSGPCCGKQIVGRRAETGDGGGSDSISSGKWGQDQGIGCADNEWLDSGNHLKIFLL